MFHEKIQPDLIKQFEHLCVIIIPFLEDLTLIMIDQVVLNGLIKTDSLHSYLYLKENNKYNKTACHFPLPFYL